MIRCRGLRFIIEIEILRYLKILRRKLENKVFKSIFNFTTVRIFSVQTFLFSIPDQPIFPSASLSVSPDRTKAPISGTRGKKNIKHSHCLLKSRVRKINFTLLFFMGIECGTRMMMKKIFFVHLRQRKCFSSFTFSLGIFY